MMWYYLNVQFQGQKVNRVVCVLCELGTEFLREIYVKANPQGGQTADISNENTL